MELVWNLTFQTHEAKIKRTLLAIIRFFLVIVHEDRLACITFPASLLWIQKSWLCLHQSVRVYKTLMASCTTKTKIKCAFLLTMPRQTIIKMKHIKYHASDCGYIYISSFISVFYHSAFCKFLTFCLGFGLVSEAITSS